MANSIHIHTREFKGSQFFNSEFCSTAAEVTYLIAEVEARRILVTGTTRSRALSPHVAPGTGCLEKWQCHRLSECEIARRLPHYASFINAPCHPSLLTSFLTVGKQSGGMRRGGGGEMARAQRGQGQKAVVPHLEWDSNKARRCHGNRRRATPHPLSRERPQGASLSRSVFERGKWPSASDPYRSRRLASQKGPDKGA